MKRLLATGAMFVVTAVGPAMAADLPVYKALPLETQTPPPGFGWSGWYVGLNAGGGWSNGGNTATQTFCNSVFITTPLACIVAGESLRAALPAQFDTHPSGFLGGGQIGYSYQIAPSWVAGIEADFQGADIKVV